MILQAAALLFIGFGDPTILFQEGLTDVIDELQSLPSILP